MKICDCSCKFFVDYIYIELNKKHISCRKILSKKFKPFFGGVFWKFLESSVYIVNILGEENFWIRDSGVEWIKLICFSQTQKIYWTW